MKTNLGTLDRLFRIVAALLIGVLYFTNQISGTTLLVLGAFAGILTLTSLVGFCPLYLPFGLSTKKSN